MTNQNNDIPDLPFLSAKPTHRAPKPASPEPNVQAKEPSKEDRLKEARQKIVNCRKCPLGFQRTNAVPGEGPADAKIMFIAEGPGQNEDLKGRPFVGAAGTFLDELLEMSGLDREDVYITNMIKCRAPENRDPKPEEMEACSHHLDSQIEIIDPDVIVALGKFSLGKFLPGETIGKAGGTLRRKSGRNIYPIMHPAAGLRRGEFKQRVIKDFLALPDALKQAQENPPEEEPEPEPKQQEVAEQQTLF